MIMLRIIRGTEPLAEKRGSSRNRLKNKRGDTSMDSDHSPETPDGGNASVKQNIPSLPSGLETKEVHRTVLVLNRCCVHVHTQHKFQVPKCEHLIDFQNCKSEVKSAEQIL